MNNDRNDFGQTPFLEACWNGSAETVEKMIAANPRVVDERDSRRNQTALHIVCYRLIQNFCESSHFRFWRLLKLLLASDIDVDAQDSRQWTALHYLMCSRLRTDWLLNEIELLLARKPCITVGDDKGRTVAQDFPLFHKYFEYCTEKQFFVRKEEVAASGGGKDAKKITILKRE